MRVLQHNYTLYIIIWFIIAFFLPYFFRVMYKKIQKTEDPQTRNSLFTVTMFIGVPLTMICIITPLIFIVGDSSMSSIHRYIWIGLFMILIIHFLMKQRSRK